MPFDRPREADTPPDARLWVLAQRLEGQRLRVELSDQTLIVHSPYGGPPVTVVCRARTDDGGRPWFFTPSGMPITEIDRIIDAALIIRSLLDKGCP